MIYTSRVLVLHIDGSDTIVRLNTQGVTPHQDNGSNLEHLIYIRGDVESLLGAGVDEVAIAVEEVEDGVDVVVLAMFRIPSGLQRHCPGTGGV